MLTPSVTMRRSIGFAQGGDRHQEMLNRRYRCLLPAALATLALGLSGSALADQQCGWMDWTEYSGVVTKELPLANIYLSSWDETGTTDYHARREDSSGAITYDALVENGSFHVFTNCSAGTCSDPYRQTAIKNSSGGTQRYTIESWTGRTTCNSS